eukprot:CAMPEP_0173170006 /NCGR_PEP_ID=MMETSP1141-20130122/1009_1 /TAXON_ID=483371 /ORGANISM="non described non described, Strain CCMP2298" /LENGTH=456 /DNA_ID=CAMNT_0014091875 /DNA_START=89 /DNA_END=1455 /DNA_ORIENTATION=-
MGGGASTSSTPTQKYEPEAIMEKMLEKDAYDARKFGASPFSPSPLDAPDVADAKTDTLVSAGKLKRMAFGQQTYMDQQRDYDSTLSKVEHNKSGTVNWSPPSSADKTSLGSPSRRKELAIDPKGLTPDKGFSLSTPDGARRQANPSRKPPPPKPAGAGAGALSPTLQAVQAPSHMRLQPTTGPMGPVGSREQSPMRSGIPMSPPAMSPPGGPSPLQTQVQSHNSSFSSPPVHSQGNMTRAMSAAAGPGIPAGWQVAMNTEGAGAGGVMHRAASSPSNTASGPFFGPPGQPPNHAGLKSKPFPGHREADAGAGGGAGAGGAGAIVGDDASWKEDAMMGYFEGPEDSRLFKRPDCVPMLSMNKVEGQTQTHITQQTPTQTQSQSTHTKLSPLQLPSQMPTPTQTQTPQRQPPAPTGPGPRGPSPGGPGSKPGSRGGGSAGGTSTGTGTGVAMGVAIGT